MSAMLKDRLQRIMHISSISIAKERIEDPGCLRKIFHFEKDSIPAGLGSVLVTLTRWSDIACPQILMVVDLILPSATYDTCSVGNSHSRH
ncbi:uncharacterized protein RCO7_14444 [Rhynchosporium graminicola]|uniref:Uncharacterized protein n=1 Tax=Rhynchosporium graminicola TaxID=2792576 RepID=A0A1E1KHH5_9HELO|nr:uncharacterized protein RCO7_14444 [Rhynchosporium commune]